METNIIEMSDVGFAVLKSLTIIGGIIVGFGIICLITWPFRCLWRIDAGQDAVLEDLDEIKKKLENAPAASERNK